VTRTVEVESVSEGWLHGTATVLAAPGRQANHLFIRMREPLPEVEPIRTAFDALLIELDHQPIDEVRNTIFPVDTAEDTGGPAELAADYVEHYDFIRLLGSEHGTYFGRVVAHPRSGGEAGPQLVHTIEKLKKAKKGKRWKAIYEVNIYSEEHDRNIKRGFPCMSHLAFQLDGERVDCLATYRSHDMIKKAYGNYLGLAELQRYVADQSGFEPGELSVLAGHAAIEGLNRAQLDELRILIAEHS
jgi:thymidylate synthase